MSHFFVQDARGAFIAHIRLGFHGNEAWLFGYVEIYIRSDYFMGSYTAGLACLLAFKQGNLKLT